MSNEFGIIALFGLGVIFDGFGGSNFPSITRGPLRENYGTLKGNWGPSKTRDDACQHDWLLC